MDIQPLDARQLFAVKKSLAIAAQVVEESSEARPMKELLDDLCGGNVNLVAAYARIANEALARTR